MVRVLNVVVVRKFLVKELSLSSYHHPSARWQSTAKSDTRDVYKTIRSLVWVLYVTRESIVWPMPQLSDCLAWLYGKSSSFRFILLVFGTNEWTFCTTVQKKITHTVEQCWIQVFPNCKTYHAVKKNCLVQRVHSVHLRGLTCLNDKPLKTVAKQYSCCSSNCSRFVYLRCCVFSVI